MQVILKERSKINPADTILVDEDLFGILKSGHANVFLESESGVRTLIGRADINALQYQEQLAAIRTGIENDLVKALRGMGL